jgi:hypothetical protein
MQVIVDKARDHSPTSEIDLLSLIVYKCTNFQGIADRYDPLSGYRNRTDYGEIIIYCQDLAIVENSIRRLGQNESWAQENGGKRSDPNCDAHRQLPIKRY